MSVLFNEEEANEIVNKILKERLHMSDVLFFQKDDQIFEVKAFEAASREGIEAEIADLESLLEGAKAKLAKFDALVNPPTTEPPVVAPEPTPAPAPETPPAPVPAEPALPTPTDVLQPAPVILQ